MMTLTIKERNMAINWFPWLTDKVNMLDKTLIQQLEFASLSINQAEATLLLRWYVNVPEGYRSRSTQHLADKIYEYSGVVV